MTRKPLTAPCSLEFTAWHSSGTRSPSDVKWIVMHDEEAPTARSAAVYFTSPNSKGSAHLCVDDNECYRTLPGNKIPWGASSHHSIQANFHGFHIEQAGYARWSAVIWRSHVWTLRRSAYKAALWAHVYSVPAEFVDANGLIAGKRGITTHAEVTKASKKLDPSGNYSHTDPGPFWPQTLFMALVRYYHRRMVDGSL